VIGCVCCCPLLQEEFEHFVKRKGVQVVPDRCLKKKEKPTDYDGIARITKQYRRSKKIQEQLQGDNIAITEGLAGLGRRTCCSKTAQCLVSMCHRAISIVMNALTLSASCGQATRRNQQHRYVVQRGTICRLTQKG
jgi:hypothetical protein